MLYRFLFSHISRDKQLFHKMSLTNTWDTSNLWSFRESLSPQTSSLAMRFSNYCAALFAVFSLVSAMRTMISFDEAECSTGMIFRGEYLISSAKTACMKHPTPSLCSSIFGCFFNNKQAYIGVFAEPFAEIDDRLFRTRISQGMRRLGELGRD